ncbi:hypothetical protein Hypma_013179 [Hypsizygus marmoreus]|uniref:Uncharacterized protein n=1 Tax=Hypsizygus marmoreus TaxID=39966 RepID=A0A369JJ46_HYPMA|nr:hypothetical protein Hypma_013179 [Hypsizygus marmoreus]
MILRVFALFGKSLLILTILLALWAVQIIISSVGVSTGFASLWIAPLATNSVILFLTIYRTRNFLAKTGHTPTIDIFVRDGMIYFFVIFLANLLNTLIYFNLAQLAVEDLKSIGAPFSALITATMISRLMLNLRSSPTTRGLGTDTYQQKASIRFMVRTIGNLGEDIEMYDIRSFPRKGSSEDEGMADRHDEVYIP